MKFKLSVEFKVDGGGYPISGARTNNDTYFYTEHDALLPHFLNMLWLSTFCPLASVDVYALSMNDTGANNGTARSTGGYRPFSLVSGAGNWAAGPVVGIGTAAVTFNDTRLATPIPSANTAGNLAYQAVTFGAPATTGNNRSWTAVRVFWNRSGGAITCNEAGLYVWAHLGDGNDRYYCIARDLIVPGVTINNNNNGTLTYTFTIAV